MPLVNRARLHPSAAEMLDSLTIRNSHPPFNNQQAARYLDENQARLDRDAEELTKMLETKLPSAGD